MRFSVECKDLSKADQEFVEKGLKSYMELFDIDTQIHLEEKSESELPHSDIAFLEAIELLSDKILLLRNVFNTLNRDFSEHTAIGNPLHKVIE